MLLHHSISAFLQGRAGCREDEDGVRRAISPVL